MTLDQAMEKVTREIDARLEQMNDAAALDMIARDIDPDLMLDLLAEYRAEQAAWRLETLDAIRAGLLAF